MKLLLTPRYKQIFTMLLLLVSCGVLLFFVLEKFGIIADAFGTIVSILTPFLIGSVIAFLLKPICNTLDRWIGDWFVKRVMRGRITSGRATESQVRKTASVFSIALSMLFFAGIVVGLLAMVIPSVIREITSLINSLPTYIANMDAWFATLDVEENVFYQTIYDIYQSFKEYITELTEEGGLLASLKDRFDDIFSMAGTVVSRVIDVLISIVVAVVSAFNILYNRKRFGAQANLITRATFKKSTADWLVKEAKFADRKFSEFFSGKMLDSFIVGIILFVLFTIFRIPNAGLISVFMAFCNMIPFFGPFIGAIPCALLIFMADPTNLAPIITYLVIVVVIQQIDGNILDPYIVGDTIGLSSFWVLFAVIIFGDLFGFVGLLVGVPLFAIIYDLIEQLVEKFLKKRGEEQLMSDYNFIYHNPEEERGARRRRVEAIKAARMQARANDEFERREAERIIIAIAQAAEQERMEMKERIRQEEIAARERKQEEADSTPLSQEDSDTQMGTAPVAPSEEEPTDILSDAESFDHPDVSATEQPTDDSQ